LIKYLSVNLINHFHVLNKIRCRFSTSSETRGFLVCVVRIHTLINT